MAPACHPDQDGSSGPLHQQFDRGAGSEATQPKPGAVKLQIAAAAVAFVPAGTKQFVESEYVKHGKLLMSPGRRRRSEGSK